MERRRFARTVLPVGLVTAVWDAVCATALGVFAYRLAGGGGLAGGCGDGAGFIRACGWIVETGGRACGSHRRGFHLGGDLRRGRTRLAGPSSRHPYGWRRSRRGGCLRTGDLARHVAPGHSARDRTAAALWPALVGPGRRPHPVRQPSARVHRSPCPPSCCLVTCCAHCSLLFCWPSSRSRVRIQR